MNYNDADRLLEQAEGELAIARQLMESRKNSEQVYRLLSGVSGACEMVKISIKQLARHCAKHDTYTDSCHDCYQVAYRGKKPT